jgi:type III secretion protein R
MQAVKFFQPSNICRRQTARRIFLSFLFVIFSAAATFAQVEKPQAAATATPQATPVAAAATTPTARRASNDGTANPVVLIVVMGVMALAPFALIMLTSFVKISVVLSILRNALGTQQIPPNQVITGLSLILTIFIMSPVAEKMYAQAGDIGNTDAIFSELSVREIFEGSKRGREPLRDFLLVHAHESDRVLFFDWARKMAQRNGNDPSQIEPNEFRVVIPAFVTSQLAEAFAIGFLLFIPFLVIDLVVANILQAMGMFMLSPTIISLPFKLLLFVLINGWVLLVKALVLGYA